MKLKKLLTRIGLTAVVFTTPDLQLSTAQGQGTAFTYQGRLDIAGTPANGTNDLAFMLYDAASAGAAVGIVNTFHDLVITNGLFTVMLDFGTGAFDGNARWLQIAARPGAGTGVYTNLVPRHPITPSPYAIFAGGASAAGVTGTLPAAALRGVSGSGLTSLNASNLTSGTVADARLSANVALRSGGNMFSGTQVINKGNVGIGIINPVAQLDVRGPSTVVGGIALGDYNITNSRYIGIIRPGQPEDIGTGSGFSGVEFGGPAGNTDSGLIAFHTHSFGEGSAERMRIDRMGRVGIGTTTPNASLHVVTLNNYPTPGLSLAGAVPDLTLNLQNTSVDGHNWALLSSGTGSAAAGALRFFDSTAGRDRLVISSFGNVGIGTGNPLFPLQVRAGVNQNLVVEPGSNIGIPGAVSIRGVNDANNENAPVVLFGNPIALQGGNVGIGTPKPRGNLDVNGNAYVNGNLLIKETAAIFGLGRLHIQSGNSNQLSGLYLNAFAGGGDVFLGGAANPNVNLNVGGEVTCTAVNITSDRDAKEGFKPVSAREVLAKVAALPITEWQYKTQGEARHIGPMAQDFHAAFGTGRDDKHITSIDADGVALAAIQGLNEKLEERDAEIGRLKAGNQYLAERLAAIEHALGLKHGQPTPTTATGE